MSDTTDSATRWLFTTCGRFLLMVSVTTFLLFVFTSPAVLVVPAVMPAAEPYLWLAIVGLAVSVSSPDLTERETRTLQALLEDIDSLSRSAQTAFLATFLVLLVSGLSVLVGTLGIVGALATERSVTALAAIPLAVLYPQVEVWLNRTVGWNLTSTGAAIVFIPVTLLARVSQTTDVSRNAFQRVRGLSGEPIC